VKYTNRQKPVVLLLGWGAIRLRSRQALMLKKTKKDFNSCQGGSKILYRGAGWGHRVLGGSFQLQPVPIMVITGTGEKSSYCSSGVR